MRKGVQFWYIKVYFVLPEKTINIIRNKKKNEKKQTTDFLKNQKRNSSPDNRSPSCLNEKEK